MLVIADSSPIIALISLGRVDILPRLFGQIVVPPAVAAELGAAARSQAVRAIPGQTAAE
jgi:predicted nucleic acid-binding protein